MVRVKVMRRKCGKPLSGYEVTVVGGMVNAGTSRIRKPTFSDQLHIYTFFLQESLIHPPPKNVHPAELAVSIHAVDVILSRFGRTLTKYAFMAITFERRPTLYKSFTGCLKVTRR